MKNLKTLVVFAALIVFVFSSVSAQIRVDEVVGKSNPGRNRDRAFSMLKGIKEALETHYYDPKYRGIDIEQKFKEAREKIKTLETNADMFRVIAMLLLEFNDSHTTFYPPARSNHVQYGFSMQMIGSQCIVVDVKKGSDAEKKGIKVGDRIAKIGQYPVTRDTLWVLNYFIYRLEPQPLLPVKIAGADGKEIPVVVEASFKTLADRRREAKEKRKEKQENPYKCHKVSADTTACKLRTFSVDKKYIDQMMKEASAGSKLILDLRGNGGGYVKIEEYLVGHFFDREVKIADIVTRKKTETRYSKPVKDRLFKGELIVLIDSNSASASEMFARVIQLEKRGKVVGDVSAGAVMTSYNLTMANSRGPDGYETVSLYGMNVTIADVIMSDGNRIEHLGVMPDHPVGPTSQALLQRNDPVLAFAAELLGARITPEIAGKFDFLHKKTEDDDDDDAEDEAEGN